MTYVTNADSAIALASYPLLWRNLDSANTLNVTGSSNNAVTVALSNNIDATFQGDVIGSGGLNNSFTGNFNSITVERGNGSSVVLTGDIYIDSQRNIVSGTIDSVTLLTPSGRQPIQESNLNLDVQALIARANGLDTDNDSTGGGDSVFDLKQILEGDDNTNIMYGSDNGDVISGYGNTDVLIGQQGDDIIFGGAGFADATDAGDEIYGGSGSDHLYGNAGNDVIYGFGAETGVDGNDVIFGGLGEDIVWAQAGNDVVNGGAGSDRIYGNEGDDILIGGNSIIDTTDNNDSIFGGEGSDALYGNAGADILFGAEGNDTIYGGLGDDTINAGSNENTLWGNTGNDVFVFSADAGTSLIVDFTAGEDSLAFSEYTEAQIMAGWREVEGGSVIDLSDGTLIALANISSLSESDITIFS